MPPCPPLEILALSIKRLQYRNYRAADARLAPLGISLVQWGALREIERNPGLCMHRLAELTFNSDQAFGTLMTRLLRQKLVARHAGTGRANVHCLTPQGKTLLDQGRKRVHQIFAKTFAKLDSDECARLQSLLTKALDEKGRRVEPHSSRTTRQPVTHFVKTTIGVVSEPGHPLVRADRHHDKKVTEHKASARRRGANPSTRAAN